MALGGRGERVGEFFFFFSLLTCLLPLFEHNTYRPIHEKSPLVP